KDTPSLRTLRQAIPDHCFQPSTAVSLYFISRDIALYIVLFALILYIPYIEVASVRWILWLTATFFQGLVFMGIHILAHECGHGALFPSQSMNNAAGFVLHSILLVPFFPWKYTHARHHRYAQHLKKDTEYAEKTAIYQLLWVIVFQIVGWPLDLLPYFSGGFDSTPSRKRGWFSAGHYNPQSSLFTNLQQQAVLMSDAGIALVLVVLWRVSVAFLQVSVAIIWRFLSMDKPLAGRHNISLLPPSISPVPR
ncbi:hypothetical protein LLEC1_07826, partial [Akanthomyces lecanii]